MLDEVAYPCLSFEYTPVEIPKRYNDAPLRLGKKQIVRKNCINYSVMMYKQ